MDTNNSFSFQRFALLFRESFKINKKVLGISLIGAAGILFLSLMLLQKMYNYQYWSNQNGIALFLFYFIGIGGIYTSQSFPSFRSKEKSLSFILLPASASEKFLYEFLIRIVALIVLFPPFFWIIANLEGALVHHYVPQLVNYEFSFSQFLSSKPGIDLFVIVPLFLFVYIVTFTGACHFSKSPRMKTLFTLSIIAAGYFLFAYVLVKGLNLNQYSPVKTIIFPKNNEELKTIFAIAAMVVNLTLIALAWFIFKEKEV